MNSVPNKNELFNNDTAVSALKDLFKTSYHSSVNADAIEKGIARLTPETMPISGEIANQLIFTKPCMLPKRVWGGGIGFRSLKRMKRLLEFFEMPPDTFPSGELFWLRFVVDSEAWVPHPYNVPHWALESFGTFSRIRNDEIAFSICKQWEKENNDAVYAIIKERLQSFKLQYQAVYNSGFSYVDVAILVNPPTPELLRASTIWQHETQLADLVKTIFPDAVWEYLLHGYMVNSSTYMFIRNVLLLSIKGNNIINPCLITEEKQDLRTDNYRMSANVNFVQQMA